MCWYATDAPDAVAVTLYDAWDMNDADATAHLLRLADAHLFSFVIVTPRRATHRRRVLVDALAAERIESRPVWRLNHEQLPHRDCPSLGAARAADFVANTVTLPCSVDLTESAIDRVCEVLRHV